MVPIPKLAVSWAWARLAQVGRGRAGPVVPHSDVAIGCQELPTFPQAAGEEAAGGAGHGRTGTQACEASGGDGPLGRNPMPRDFIRLSGQLTSRDGRRKLERTHWVKAGAQASHQRSVDAFMPGGTRRMQQEEARRETARFVTEPRRKSKAGVMYPSTPVCCCRLRRVL